MARYPVAYRKAAVRADYPNRKPPTGIRRSAATNRFRPLPELPETVPQYQELLKPAHRAKVLTRDFARRAARIAARRLPYIGNAMDLIEIADNIEKARRENQRVADQARTIADGVEPRAVPDFTGWTWQSMAGVANSFPPADVADYAILGWHYYSVPNWGGGTFDQVDYEGFTDGSYYPAPNLYDRRSYYQFDFGRLTVPDPDVLVWGTNGRYWRLDSPTIDPLNKPRYRIRRDVEPDQGGNRPGRRTAPEERTEYVEPVAEPATPETAIAPSVRPNDWSLSADIPVSAGRPPAPARPPVNHWSKPPGRSSKERKWHIMNSRLVRVVWGAFGSATEASDLIDALWDALPKSAKSGYYRLHGKGGKVFWKWRHKVDMKTKARDLWRNYDKLDLSEAIKNIAFDQLQDAAIGKLGKTAQEKARPVLEMLGRPVGFGFGPAL